ncbi:hypothetical protein Salat_2579400 [Sesamum alatum]|uniref:Uncharacterized protein n=1 Tax=Sesamum alatum TaxID=300844 RepID=A0AAE2CAG2_9LAMI|nr:hypothetical protein Salat_2579400 [Sesamum alatum]
MCYSFLSLYGVNYSGLQMFSSKRWVSVPKSLFSLPYGLDPFHRYCSTVPDSAVLNALECLGNCIDPIPTSLASLHLGDRASGIKEDFRRSDLRLRGKLREGNGLHAGGTDCTD